VRDPRTTKPVAKKPVAKKPVARKPVGKKPAARRPAGGAPPGVRRRRFLPAALLGVVLVGLLFVFVYPTRTFLDERRATSRAQTQLALLQAENKKLAGESKLLNSDAEIERLARERYGLVKPGEQAFVIVPVPTTPPPPTEPSSNPSSADASSTTAGSAPTPRP
jgi:cell division protein FtsB